MKFPYILIGICTVVICLVYVWMLIPQDNLLDTIEEEDINNDSPVLVLTQNDQYKKAVEFMNNGNPKEARDMFRQLGESSPYVEQVAHLRQKEMQSTLVSGDYKMAIGLLADIVTNPTFPNGVKARSMENVFQEYRGQANDHQIFREIFYTWPFDSMRGETIGSSWYSYFTYSYGLYPTTVAGRHLFFYDLVNLEQITQIEEVELKRTAMQVFLDDYFVNSDREIDGLKKYANQETLLVSLHADRALVAEYAASNGFSVPQGVNIHDEYYESYKNAQVAGSQFHKFYSLVRYIDYLYNTKENPDLRMQVFLQDSSIFDSEKISEINYSVAVGVAKEWAEEELIFVENLSPAFMRLIEFYSETE